jgi:hypothetical protein
MAAAKTRIAHENELPGTRGWLIHRPAVNREIEGFCVPSSVAPGDSVSVHISTSAHKFRAELFRLGFYDGTGGRLLDTFGPFPGARLPDPNCNSRGAGSCEWPSAFTIPISKTAVSGCYPGPRRSLVMHQMSDSMVTTAS